MEKARLVSLAAYSTFIAECVNRQSVVRSNIVVWSESPFTGIAEGEVLFTKGFRLRMREEIDFSAGLITSYGYEIYKNESRLFWYDDFPHPNDPELKSTFPHHKHIAPDIKRHRISAPGIYFDRPNLQRIMQEIESLG